MMKNFGYGAMVGACVFIGFRLIGVPMNGWDMVGIIAGCAGLIGYSISLYQQLVRQPA
jgi:hypothetical protein